MTGKTEDMIDRYLEAVAAQLPVEERDDIIAELKDLILSRVEAREEEQGRALTDDEREAILREIGHPLVVAARYRKGPDSLIGPELFPYWLFGAKAGLLVLGTVFCMTLAIRLLSGSANFGQDIAQAFHGFLGAGIQLIGALTIAGAVMEHYAVRPKWLTDWRVKDLAAFGMADVSKWGTALNAARPARTVGVRTPPYAEPLGSAVFLLVFAFWWMGALHFPGLATFSLDGVDDVSVTAGPIWTTLFTPILVYAFCQMGAELFRAFSPDSRRLQAVFGIVLAGAGLWLTWTILMAGHWFTLTEGVEQARVAGGLAMLDPERLNVLSDGPRTLERVAYVASVIGSWIIAISGISLIYKALANMVRLARG